MQTTATTASPQPQPCPTLDHLDHLDPGTPAANSSAATATRPARNRSRSGRIPPRSSYSSSPGPSLAGASSDVADLQHESAWASATEWPELHTDDGVDQIAYHPRLHDGSDERDLQRDQVDVAELLGLPAQECFEESLYYDAATMAGLNSFSLAALNRLRAYKPPPFPLWDSLPARRRAAVLLLLYADRWGDMRVVITMRAASLRSFSGHAALPGGKADSKDETPSSAVVTAGVIGTESGLTSNALSPDQIARREAFEEIGLPMDDERIPKPFRIEPICFLPPSLARTHLVVTPVVAFLHADKVDADSPTPLVEESLIPRLDAREVAAVFSAPFYNFLKADDLPPRPGQELPPGAWYEGAWMSWKDLPWRVHNFHVPVNNQRVVRPRRASAQGNLGEALEEQQQQEGRFKVWGMTGRLLVDAARIAYGEEPEMEHNETYGDYDIILRAEEDGVFKEAEEAQKPASNEPAKM
ncbi:hypothetical protein E4U42_005275 [Claviceps africana]|uniref:Nudix hydrolase domain-containing protein n=1 Tax=Claviceps africana TaxID=83212 RepID=A0A8K0JD67_9HYPO|nr:hypothetical protein E4U42_005275 [Claviceps africana]